MTMNDRAASPDSSRRLSGHLRRIGGILLLLGVSGAGIVYWAGTRSSDSSDDPALAGYDKAGTRQMAVLYGKMGLMIEDLSGDLKRPGTQAALIVVISTLAASGCFYLGRPHDDS
jgi:hypothetical protein